MEQVNSQVQATTPLVKALWLKQFVEVYQTLSTDNIDLINDIYHPQVHFIDPIHNVRGIYDLNQYFANLYTNILSCSFVIEHVIESGDEANIIWQMVYQHPKLNKGKTITVEGSSHLKAKDGKVIYHRDYVDLGQMLYEHVPVIGACIRLLKRRASQ